MFKEYNSYKFFELLSFYQNGKYECIKFHNYKPELYKKNFIARYTFQLIKSGLIFILFFAFFTTRLFAQIPPGNFH